MAEEDVEEKYITEKKTLLPPVISAALSFILPLFLILFVGLELFTTLIGYPNVYPSMSVVHLSPLTFIEDFWLPTLAASFLLTLALFIFTLIGFDFLPKESITKKTNISIKKLPLMIAAIFTLIIFVSLISNLVAHYQAGEELTFILLGLVLITGFSQVDVTFEPRSFFEKEVVKEEKLCPECGAVMPAERDRCPECGEMIEEPVEEVVERPELEELDKEVEEIEPEETEEEEVEMIDPEVVEPEPGDELTEEPVKAPEIVTEELEECPVCGAEIPLEAEICPVCDEPLTEESEEELAECPICGAETSPEDDRCSLCGEPLTEEAEIEETEDLQECDFCGATVPLEEDICPICDEPLSKEPVEEELEPEPEEPEEEPEEELDECPVCGSEVSPEEDFCPVCDEPLTEEAKEEMDECPICGATVSSDQEICPVCDEPLTEEAKKAEEPELTSIPIVDKKMEEILKEHGLETPADIKEGGLAVLAEITELDFTTAKEILEGAQNPEKLISKEEAIEQLREIEGVGHSTAENLYEAGYRTPQDLKEADVEDLEQIDGIASRLAQIILQDVQED